MDAANSEHEAVERGPASLRWLLLLGIVGVSAWACWESRGTIDVDLWLNWIRKVGTLGPVRGYAAIHADYPPGASLTLWVVGRLAIDTSRHAHDVLKLVLFGFLLITTGVLLVASGRMVFAAIAHATLVPSAISLMYLDILTAPFILGAVWAAGAGREPLMIGLIGAACVMKWQPIFVMPFAIVYLVLQRPVLEEAVWRRKVWLSVVVLGGLCLLVVLPYGLSPVLDALWRASRHNNLSNFGANPLWILTWWRERASPGFDGLVAISPASQPMLGVLSLLTLLVYGAVVRRYWTLNDRTIGAFVRFSLAGYLVYFMCSAGVHENHLFVAHVLALALAWNEPRRFGVFMVVAAAANLNLVAFYGLDGRGAPRLIHGADITVWVALAISVAVVTVGRRLIAGKKTSGVVFQDS